MLDTFMSGLLITTLVILVILLLVALVIRDHWYKHKKWTTDASQVWGWSCHTDRAKLSELKTRPSGALLSQPNDFNLTVVGHSAKIALIKP